MTKKNYTLSAKNFQSWRDLSLPMTGFTVIIGPSDRGKSAIVRALRGVLRNEVGSNHITYGEKEAEVCIDANGTEVKITRGKTTSYQVDGEEFSKLQKAVPPSVEAMKFNAVEVNGVKLDPIFAGQFDSQFMLDLSPAELNSIFGLFSSTEKLNAGKKAASTKNVELNATAKFLASEILEAETTKAALNTLVDEFDEQSKVIFDLEDVYNSAATTVHALKTYQMVKAKCADLHSFTDQVLPSSATLTNILYLGRLLVQYNKRSKLTKDYQEVTSAKIPSLDTLSYQCQTINRFISMGNITRKIKMYSSLPSVPSSASLQNLLTSRKMLVTYVRLKQAIEDKKVELKEVIKDRGKLQDELSALKGGTIQCPECGHFFNGDTHGHE